MPWEHLRENIENLGKDLKEDKVKIALCHFTGGTKLYAFKTIEQNLKFGDTVIVNVLDGFEIVKFIEYTDSSQMRNIASKWLIEKIDIQGFYNKVKELDKLINIRR